MKKETTKKSKLWIWIVAIAVLLLAAGGAVLAFVLGGGQGDQPDGPGTTVPTGPRADLYWNLDKEFYTANSQTGLSTREADANGQFKMRFAYNGEIVELVIIDKKLVNIIDTQDVLGLQFDENGVVIGQINVRDLATEVGKKVYVKKTTADTIVANSSMAMNGMELNLKMGQYAEIYDLRPDSETFGKKITTADLQVMDCMTVYANADGDVTHVFLLSSGDRSKIYWRANLWVSATVNRGGLDPDAEGVYTLPFYCEGELVQIKTKDVDIVDYYAELGKHNGFTGLIFDENGYAIDIMNAAIGVAGQQTFYALDVVEIDGTYVKLENNWSTSGVQNWEGNIPAETPIYNVSTWAYSEGVMGQKISVTDLKVGDRITMFSDMEGNPIEIGLTLRRVDLNPMFNNNSKYDAATRSTTRVKNADGYWEYTFINEKGIHKYKTKDEKLATFIDSYPERVFGIVTKGDMLVKAYEYECLYGYTRFSTALYVDSINGTIISCADQKKANAYTAVLSADYKVLDISGDSKQWGQKIELQVGDCMISFRNTNQEVCMIYVTKRSMGGSLYVVTEPNTSRPITTVYEEDGTTVKEQYWEYQVTDLSGKQKTLKLPVGKLKDGVYANKYLQSRIDGATRGIIALEVSGTKIKDAHAVGNMASGNAVSTVIITKAGTTEFEYKTVAKPNDEASIYPGWTGESGMKKINLSGDYKSHKGEKLSGSMKVNDVYYMVRNRANETIAMFLTSRGWHNDLFFVKNPYGVVGGVTQRPTDANGYYVFDVMYDGKAATVRTKDVALATKLEGMRNGAALKLDKSERPFTFTGVSDYTGTGDAYASLVNNWDVSKISGKNVTLTLNIPTTSTTVGDTKEVDITGATIYNISPDAGADFGKTTKLQKNDRVRIYTDKNGKVSYVLVTVRGGVKTAMCEHCGKKVTWNPLTASSGLGTGTAHYYVFADWDIYSQQSVSSTAIDKYEVVIDLNGKTVFNKGNATRSFMVAYPGKTLTLMDSVGGGIVKSYGYNGNAGLIQVSYGATLNILGGTYQLLNEDGMVTPKQGGVIFSWNDNNYPDHRNTVNIKGGNIIGAAIEHPNRATTDPLMTSDYAVGGTVYGQKTDFYMSGGTISGGTADRGGNLYLGSTAVFTMTGGEITGGQARNRGGNVFMATGAKIVIDGGKITDGKVLAHVIDYMDGDTPAQKKTGQQGGNIFGYDIVLKSGEITGGHANTTGGNIFLMSNNNKLEVYGGKIAGGTANSGAGNVYVYGGEGLVAVHGGEIDASGVTLANGGTGTAGSAMNITGGKVGSVSIATDSAIVVGGDAKIDYLSISKTAKPMGITELSSTAKIVVKAEGQFAKAAAGSEALDIAPYAGNQIVASDPATTTITCETIENVKYLVATVASTEPDEPDEPDVPDVPVTPDAPDPAQMEALNAALATATTNVDAFCPVCKKDATWVPLTAEMSALDAGEHTHYYLAGDITRTDNGRFRTSVDGTTVCIHLNGKTYNQGSAGNIQGAIQARASTTINILDVADNSGTVIGAGLAYESGGTTLYGGGAIDARGTVNIYGGTFKTNRADRPAVAIFGTAGTAQTVNMFGGKIVGDATVVTSTASATSSLIRMHAASHTFNMYGGEITGGIANRGGNVRLQGGTFNMYGGTIQGGTAANLGGNINVAAGTFNLIGGKILGGNCAASGGSIGLVSGALNISGGELSGGTGATGGLIYVYGGTLNITGGDLKNGTGSGGNVYLAGGTNTITGGNFVGGKVSAAADADVRAVTVAGGKTLTLGAATIDSKVYVSGTVNVQNGATAKLQIVGSGKIVLADDLADGTAVYVDASQLSEGAVLTEANAKAAEYANKYIFSADETKYLAVNGENQLYAASKQALVDALNATLATATTNVEAVCPVCVKTATWVPLTAEMGALDAGEHTHYYLAGDITRTDNGRFRTSVDGTTVCIHLNGKTYNQGSAGNIQGAIQARASTTINILDVADNSGTVIGAGLAYESGGTTLYGGGAIDARGTVNIYGGTFKTNRADRPAVANFGSAGDGSEVNMYGGRIVRNEAVVTTTDSATSSLVRMHHSKQTFNMYGGEIIGGMAQNGGNVRLQGGGNFNLIGGTIRDGQSANLGGNICNRGGVFTMTGGEVKGGVTAASGGNFGLVSGTTNFQGGTVANGTANSGGLAYVYGGTLNITGGEFKDGIGAGGNINIAGGTNTITGGNFVGGKISAAEDADIRAITVGGGKTLTLGAATIDSKVFVSGTVNVQNGVVATVELVSGGRVALADNVAEGTKVTVVAAATQTIATIENAADFLGYFESGVTGATIGVKADTTNEIEIVIPAVEPAPEA